MNIVFVLSRLWRYLNIYFLKPFDAVNDTLTSYLVFKKHGLQNNYLEIGSGDGMFSYIMCGGKFPIDFDRYRDIDLQKKDIFNTHKKKLPFNLDVKKKIRPLTSIDANQNHIKKIKEIGFSKKTIFCKYENLPIKKNSIKFIFFYTAHGLENFDKSVKSATKSLKKNGKIIFLVFDDYVKKNFICHSFYRKGILKNFFKDLNNNRYEEISGYSKTYQGWKKFFKKKGLKIISDSRGLSGTAWKFYDVQTRPILRPLIFFFNFFPNWIRTTIKIIWMIFLYPFLFIFFLFFSNLIFRSSNNCYRVFELKKS